MGGCTIQSAVYLERLPLFWAPQITPGDGSYCTLKESFNVIVQEPRDRAGAVQEGFLEEGCVTLGVCLCKYMLGLGSWHIWDSGHFRATSHAVHPTDSDELRLLSKSHFLSIDVARGDCLVLASLQVSSSLMQPIR